MVTWTDRLDRILTHRIWGTLIFLALMFGVFQAIYFGARPLMDWISDGREWLKDRVNGVMEPGPLRGLLADGVIEGVGSVLTFLPQIMMLFAFIAVLEDCGYMARAAFLMDRLMARAGLNGKSFIPLLSSVACAVPGIMSARVIENRRDRLATILVAPLMSCSARLPVYALLIGAFLSPYGPWVPGLTLFGLYMIGLVLAPLVAFLLKRTLLRGEAPVFVMEMPLYKWPSWRNVVRRAYDGGWMFVRRAGTMILASMIVIWALLYFPSTDADGRPFEQRIAAIEQQLQAQEGNQQLEAERGRLQSEWKARSLLGRVGVFIEPAVEPLGWDWRIGLAALASFPARSHGGNARHPLQSRRRQERRPGIQGSHRPDAPAPVHGAGGVVGDGVLRAVLSMRIDAGGDQARNEQLALAGVHIRLHDGAGLPGCPGRLPGRPAVSRLIVGVIRVEWQLTLTVCLVAAASAYLAWRGWRVWRASRTACAGGCGCSKTSAAAPSTELIPAEELMLRRRE